ncbi:hypothetical protein KAR91_68905, partial [Candidatus Pacearchaeota archaeon]|nr:hypothetical protein [Candidatus Pacearchaeota archaeon]
MAIIASHFEITVKVVDAGANFATLRYQMRDALYANVVIAKSTIVAALDAVTDCVIQRVSINEIWRNDAFAYPTEVKVSDKLSMTSELTGGL